MNYIKYYYLDFEYSITHLLFTVSWPQKCTFNIT